MNLHQRLTPDHAHLATVQFNKEDALVTSIDKNERLTRLHFAMKLGNNHKQKVRIHVINSSGQLLEINAKVWSVTEKYVILRNSISIPITSIREILYM